MADKKQTAVFFVDAGQGVGMGHFVRCRALARYLSKESGAEIVFVMRGGGECLLRLEKDGFEYHARNGGGAGGILGRYSPSIVVVDLAEGAEKIMPSLRDTGLRTVIIDDLGGKEFGCSILVNATAVEDFRRYPEASADKMLLGPKYMIMREEFAGVGMGARWASSKTGSIFISLGGEDPHGVIYGVIHVLEKMRYSGKVVIALGAAFHDVRKLQEMTRGLECDYEILHNVDSLALVMRHSDIAIVCGGMTLYEAACAGTPALVVAMNEHQLREAEEFARRGAVFSLGMWNVADENAVFKGLKHIMEKRALRSKMSRVGPKIVDGMGLFRVGEEILR